LLSLKAASERWTGEGEAALVESVAQRLVEASYKVDEIIELTGYEDNHRLFVVRSPEA
jgi:fibrillarin-like rRNA methylase